MQPNKLIKELIQRSGRSMRAVSRELGRADNFIYELGRQGVTPKVDTLAAIAHACGYSLQLVPNGGGESITIDPAEK